MSPSFHLRFILALATASIGHAFVPSSHTAFIRTVLSSSVLQQAEHATNQNPHTDDPSYSIRAPLKYLGPYPAIGLRFPDFATDAMKERNSTGVSLDFILDTAANTNTLNVQVAQALHLPVVGQALPGLNAAGPIAAADTYLLGDCQLEGIADDDLTFMQELTASALPTSPLAAGLLSKAFLDCFKGGVEFDWMNGAVTFHGERQETTGRVMVTIQPLPVTLLPSVVVRLNGVEMVALLDTGSPITVVNAAAAKLAGITGSVPQQEATPKGYNPFTAMKNAISNASAASRGDVLLLAGSNGEQIQLIKSADKVDVKLSEVDFGLGQIYIGDIPGLVAMSATLGVDAPACVLGLDVLRTKPMLYRGQDNEVYFPN